MPNVRMICHTGDIEEVWLPVWNGSKPDKILKEGRLAVFKYAMTTGNVLVYFEE